MHCIHCGIEVPENAQYCLSCGRKILKPEDPQKTIPAEKTSGEGLFTPKGKRIAVIVGIAAAAVILLGAVSFGVVTLYSLREKSNAGAANESTEKSQTEDSQHESSDESVSESTEDTVITSETKATTAVPSRDQSETNTYTQFIEDTLIPQFGLANPEVFQLDCTWYAGFMDLREFMPEDRKGIVSSHLEDLNSDGDLELLVVIAKTFAEPVVHTNDFDDYVYETHYDGVEVRVFHIVSGAVQEMVSDNKDMIYSEAFTYASDEAMQVSVLTKGDKKYIYVMKYNLYISEGSTDMFEHDIYEVTEAGIHCMESMITYGGVIYDALDISSGTGSGLETFSIWSGGVIEDYYNTIKGTLEPYGLDCSWMDSYYDVIQVDNDFNMTFSRGINKSYTPLSAMISNVRVITMAAGDCEYDPDRGVTTQSCYLLNFAEGLIARPMRVLPLPNSQAENEVAVIREIWTADQTSIDADAYAVATVAPGVVSYHNGMEIVRITLSAGTDGYPYARTYEYTAGKLIFAYIARGEEENRLYLKDEILFRWRFSDGANDPVNHDNAVGNAKFLAWEARALEEGRHVLDVANGL